MHGPEKGRSFCPSFRQFFARIGAHSVLGGEVGELCVFCFVLFFKRRSAIWAVVCVEAMVRMQWDGKFGPPGERVPLLSASSRSFRFLEPLRGVRSSCLATWLGGKFRRFAAVEMAAAFVCADSDGFGFGVHRAETVFSSEPCCV